MSNLLAFIIQLIQRYEVIVFIILLLFFLYQCRSKGGNIGSTWNSLIKEYLSRGVRWVFLPVDPADRKDVPSFYSVIDHKQIENNPGIFSIDIPQVQAADKVSGTCFIILCSFD